MTEWKFYGRQEQLAELDRMLGRQRWFFAKVTGRRRIGKTTLIQRAIQDIGSNQPVFYVQVPDSAPAGVISAVNDALEIRFGSCKRSPKKLLSDMNNFKEHVGRFLETMPKYQGWKRQYVGIAPVLDEEQRAILTAHDIIPQDLNTLTRDLS